MSVPLYLQKARKGEPQYFVWLEKYLKKRKLKQDDKDFQNTRSAEEALQIINFNRCVKDAWISAGPAAESVTDVLWGQDSADGKKLSRKSRITEQLKTILSDSDLAEVDYNNLLKNYPRLSNIEGSESKLFFSEGDDYILKLQDFRNNSDTPLDYVIDRIFLHNLLFKGTEYTLEAFCLDTSEELPIVKFLVSQPYVAGRNATLEEIDSYLTEIGFSKDANSIYTNGLIRILDANERNVLVDEETGDLYFIDEVIERV